jgi:hypothetical protein
MAGAAPTGGAPVPSITGGHAGPSYAGGATYGPHSFKNEGLTVIRSNPWVTVALVVLALAVLVLFFRKKK